MADPVRFGDKNIAGEECVFVLADTGMTSWSNIELTFMGVKV